MRVLRLVFVIMLFVLVGGGQALLLPDEAQAFCCKCGECSSFCTCPGSTLECPWCPAPQKVRADSRTSLSELLSSNFSETEVADRLTDLTAGGKCARRNFTLRLLGDSEGLLKLAPIRFDESDVRPKIVAFQLEADTEK